MPGWRCLIGGVLLSLGGAVGFAAEPNLSQLRKEADTAAKLGHWDTALTAYLKLHEASPSSEYRDQIRQLLRQVKQLGRHRDLGFQQFVLTLRPAESLNLYAEVLQKLHSLHAEPRQAEMGALFQAGVRELDRALGDGSFRQRNLSLSSDDARMNKFRQGLRDSWAKRSINTAQEARAAAFELVQQAQDELGLRHPPAIVCELLCGACSSVDEYTLYLHPTATQSDLATPVLELAHYGLLVRLLAGELVIDGIVPGSWAALHTPLRKGDRILRFNGVVPNPLQPAALAQAARSPGPVGHDLELQADAHLAVPAVTLPAPLPTVYGVTLLNMRDGVGYLRMASFQESTPREFDEAVNLLKARGARVLIVDARGNPGGSFPAAVQTAQRLLPTGIIVTTQGQSAEFAHRVFSSDAGMTAHELPTVLLIDGKTMSAAEVVAAAWKDHGRAFLIGMPSFGKGAVQGKIRLQSIDQPERTGRSGSMILTLAHAFSPNGEAINGLGVIPHLLEADPGRQLDLAFSKALELLDQ